MAELKHVSTRLQLGLHRFYFENLLHARNGTFSIYFLIQIGQKYFFLEFFKIPKNHPFRFLRHFFLTNYHLKHVSQWQPHFLVVVETLTKKVQKKKLFRTQQANRVSPTHPALFSTVLTATTDAIQAANNKKIKIKQQWKKQKRTVFHIGTSDKLLNSCEPVSKCKESVWGIGAVSRGFGNEDVQPPTSNDITDNQLHQLPVASSSSSLIPSPNPATLQNMGPSGTGSGRTQCAHLSRMPLGMICPPHLGLHQHLHQTDDFCFTKARPWSTITPPLPSFRFWLLPLAIHLLWHTHLWKYKKYLFC